MLHFIALAVSISALHAQLHAEKTTLYASPYPLENADGTRTSPYSLKDALHLAQTSHVDEIILLDGEYELETTALIAIQRNADEPLLIAAENEHQALLSGAATLTNPIAKAQGLLEFRINPNSAIANARDLYIDSIRATRARSKIYSANNSAFSAIPGLSKADPQSADSPVNVATDFTLQDFSRQCVSFESWTDPNDIEFVFRCAWWEKRCTVERIGESQIYFANPGWRFLNTPWGNEASSRLNAAMPKEAWIEGAIELLDSPGEWHNGHSLVSVLLGPNDTPDQKRIRIGRLETIAHIADSSNITLKGIDFAYSTWFLPVYPNGFNDGQANFEQFGLLQRPPAALRLSNSSNVLVERCAFRQLGGIAIEITGASSDVSVVESHVSNTGASGILIGSIDETAPKPNRIAISNCLVESVGETYHSAVGIFAGYTQNTRIANNEIRDVPYSGISMGWGWNDISATDAAAYGNSITENLIHNYLREMYDGGGIYTLGPQSTPLFGAGQGLLILKNVLHNQGGLGNVIYSDGGSRWIRIVSNVTYNNLRELDTYYEGRSRYVSDWGGCSPYGDLEFSDNLLGNAENKFPNFRCSPNDPPPWGESAYTPQNTFIANNRFEEKPNFSVIGSAKSSSPDQGGTLRFLIRSSAKQLDAYASVNVSLTQRSGISFSTNHNREVQLTVSSSTGPRVQYSTISDLSLELPSGKYTLTYKYADISDLSVQLPSETFGCIDAACSAIEIQIDGVEPQTLLAYDVTHDGPIPMQIENQNGQILFQSNSWIENPYNWRILRDIVDNEFPLPKLQAAIRCELAPGHYKLVPSEQPTRLCIGTANR